MAETIGKLVNAGAALHEEASRRTGLTDFGAPDYLVGLRALCAAADQDLPATEEWRSLMFSRMVPPLVARLYAEKGWSEHPQVRRIPIVRPLIVTGHPRTGTTALHQLLAIDPQFQGLEHWLLMNPMPRPPRDTWQSNPLYRAAADAVAQRWKASPERMAAHGVAADEVDECIILVSQSFVAHPFVHALPLPSYTRWWKEQDLLPGLARASDNVRLIGSTSPGKRWLLKNPGHVLMLDELLEVYPDACIVWTHRDPRKAVPSFASLMTLIHAGPHYPNPDRRAIATQELEIWSAGIERAMQVRNKRRSQFHDVYQRDLSADPLGAVRAIYERFGMTLAPEVERAMRDWLAANPANKHGEHRYTAADFGLSDARIVEYYEDYMRELGFLP